MHEFDLINNYFFKIAKKNKFALNLNDDVFFDKKRGVVISVDTYNIGTHFYDFKSPDLVIKKILRSSISDLICKGVTPKFYFISGSGNKTPLITNPNYLMQIGCDISSSPFYAQLIRVTSYIARGMMSVFAGLIRKTTITILPWPSYCRSARKKTSSSKSLRLGSSTRSPARGRRPGTHSVSVA